MLNGNEEARRGYILRRTRDRVGWGWGVMVIYELSKREREIRKL